MIGLVDGAWAARVGSGTLQANGNRVWVVDKGRQVGTVGQTSIQIVVRDGTTQVITAFLNETLSLLSAKCCLARSTQNYV